MNTIIVFGQVYDLISLLIALVMIFGSVPMLFMCWKQQRINRAIRPQATSQYMADTFARYETRFRTNKYFFAWTFFLGIVMLLLARN